MRNYCGQLLPNYRRRRARPGPKAASRLLPYRLLVDFRPMFIDDHDLARVAGADVDGDLPGDAVGDLSGLVFRTTIHPDRVFDFHAVDNIKMKSGHWRLLKEEMPVF
jgi:hypothetical protein